MVKAKVVKNGLQTQPHLAIHEKATYPPTFLLEYMLPTGNALFLIKIINSVVVAIVCCLQCKNNHIELKQVVMGEIRQIRICSKITNNKGLKTDRMNFATNLSYHTFIISSLCNGRQVQLGPLDSTRAVVTMVQFILDKGT